MKKNFTLSVILAFSFHLFGQQTTLTAYNIQRQKISNTGLKILSSYAAANVIYGSIAASQSNGSNKYFHQMNAIWNGVTLGITGIGALIQKKEGILSFAQTLKKQSGVEKLFLFNAGLDVAYIAGGAYIKERSKNSTKNPEKLKGYGQSIMLQGGVLLLFDAIMYSIHARHSSKLDAISLKMQFGITNDGIGLQVTL